jgi:hypothetical protein
MWRSSFSASAELGCYRACRATGFLRLGSTLMRVSYFATSGLSCVLRSRLLLGCSHNCGVQSGCLTQSHCARSIRLGGDERTLPILNQLVVLPRFHHWHHAMKPVDKNFAVHFPWIDQLFGTWHSSGR